MMALKEHLAGKRHVIWDWNGTLIDDVELVVDIMGRILADHALGTLSRDAYRELFCFPVAEYYRKIGFDFEKVPFEVVSNRFIADYNREILSCRLRGGAPGLLRELRAAGVSQSILSAAHEGHLRELLAHHGILDCFDRVYGLADTHAAGKVERGRELIAASGFTIDQSILVGDTDHDLEVGRELGVDVLLLGDGHQSYERLRAIHDRVIAST
jgi:phosphoglycolate phosphatase